MNATDPDGVIDQPAKTLAVAIIVNIFAQRGPLCLGKYREALCQRCVSVVSALCQRCVSVVQTLNYWRDGHL
jgi:hypothetical protein